MSLHTATLLNGKELAFSIQKFVKHQIDLLSLKSFSFRPQLAIIQVGSQKDSNIYIKMKKTAGLQIGINVKHFQFCHSFSEDEIISKIKQLNEDNTVHGILLQLPLDCTFFVDTDKCINSISPNKDVDGLTDVSAGKLSRGDLSSFIPCTPRGVLELLRQNKIQIAGKNVVILGRSRIVGSPLRDLLIAHNATVTTLHSKSQNSYNLVSQADIVIVAIRYPELVKGDWIKTGAVVIDCGINYILDPSKRSGYKLVGDVEFQSVNQIASFITPVPGGVGPMTVAMLMLSTFESAKKFIDCSLISWKIKVLPLSPKKPPPSNLEISKTHYSKTISVLAEEIGISKSYIQKYGQHKAKISFSLLEKIKYKPNGFYVLVTAITPTPFGEGKSTTTIGLSQALGAHLGKNTFACVRQPSLGPIFGIKGGAAGGGYSQIIPMEVFNLHLTGDIHAITSANNLLAAALEARYFHEATQTDEVLYSRLVTNKNNVKHFTTSQISRLSRLGINERNPDKLSDTQKNTFARLNIDSSRITINRVVDTNDRFLRNISIGQSSTEKGFIRETQFDITVSCEIMAILSLSNTFSELMSRLSKMIIAYSLTGHPITTDDLGITPAIAILLKDAFSPTLMQTIEGTPVFVHCGPFANIAHGNSSVIADKIALKLVGRNGFVVTEAGFGADIGMEKFIDIKCRKSDLSPNCIILVVSVRALKMHGGGPKVTPGKVLSLDYLKQNIELLEKGCCNLAKQITNCRLTGVPIVVCINRFSSDTLAELDIIKNCALNYGANKAVISFHWGLGGLGAIDLGNAVIQTVFEKAKFNFLYPLEMSIVDKIKSISLNVYGAKDIHISPEILTKINWLTKIGMDKLPICIAKTHLSLSHDPLLKGAPTEFIMPINEIYLRAGAEFLLIMVGPISTMPGLPIRPAFIDMDINSETLEIFGLF